MSRLRYFQTKLSKSVKLYQDFFNLLLHVPLCNVVKKFSKHTYRSQVRFPGATRSSRALRTEDANALPKAALFFSLESFPSLGCCLFLAGEKSYPDRLYQIP